MASNNMTQHDFFEKWNWKMSYCFKKGWPPSNTYFWQKAEDAYLKLSSI